MGWRIYGKGGRGQIYLLNLLLARQGDYQQNRKQKMHLLSPSNHCTVLRITKSLHHHAIPLAISRTSPAGSDGASASAPSSIIEHLSAQIRKSSFITFPFLSNAAPFLPCPEPRKRRSHSHVPCYVIHLLSQRQAILKCNPTQGIAFIQV
jgi:hypothetical protein